MINKIIRNIIGIAFNFKKNLRSVRGGKINLVIFCFLFMIITSLVFSYNTSIKKKRMEEIDSFLSNNETILLKNYLLNKIKSPYLEYDYIVQNNDTVEMILKKFGVKQSEINFIVENEFTRRPRINLPNVPEFSALIIRFFLYLYPLKPFP